VNADVTIADLPRRTDTQVSLGLGLTDEMVRAIRRRRSNVEAILYDDMTRSTLPDASFDGVAAVEVLEHVREEGQFLHQVCRVLRPGGFFLMTTPNGAVVPRGRNPDHHRHYARDDLRRLLAAHFPEVEVEHAVAGGPYYRLGQRRWSLRFPLETVLSMLGNLVSTLRSPYAGPAMHLPAVAWKRP
jgi:SAM-dependent methyltransferase